MRVNYTRAHCAYDFRFRFEGNPILVCDAHACVHMIRREHSVCAKEGSFTDGALHCALQMQQAK